jgi:hypothetical protein
LQFKKQRLKQILATLHLVDLTLNAAMEFAHAIPTISVTHTVDVALNVYLILIVTAQKHV